MKKFRTWYILLISILFLTPAKAQELSGTQYQEKDGIVCLGGPGAGSSNYNLKNIIGTNSGSMSSSNYSIDTGLTLTGEPGGLAGEFMVEGLQARVAQGGKAIPESTWQNDNDPYFYWNPPKGKAEVAGYSYSLDELPDDEIDTSDRFYSFPDDSISDGIHGFYVKAQHSSGLWGDARRFNIWVDTTPPSLNVIEPSLGTISSDALVAITAILSDIASGVDADSIELRINQAEVSFEYNTENNKLSYTPSVPFSDGQIIINLSAADMAENEAISLIWSFIVDTKEPRGSILINNDDSTTTTNLVTLNIWATDDTTSVTEMILSNDGVFDTEVWEPFTTLRHDWTLLPITGIRKVYVMFKDQAGNISQVFFDDINLHIIAPDTYILGGPSGITQSQTAEFVFRGSLPGCRYRYKFDDEEWSGWSSEDRASKAELCEGNHYFTVSAAKDLNQDGLFQLDEIDPSPATRVWTVSFSGSLRPPSEPKKPIKQWEEE